MTTSASQLWGLLLDSYPLSVGNDQNAATVFVNGLNNVSPGNLRALWLPDSADTTETVSGGRTWTYDASIAGAKTDQGHGILVEFAGPPSGNFATTPDTANMSFGDGVNDFPCSFVALANVTDNASERPIIAKWENPFPNNEWQFIVTDTDKLRLFCEDASAFVDVGRASDAAITMGSLHLFAATYDGSGGATAMNGVTLYEDGAVVASTASNNASYVAMEPGTSIVTLADLGSNTFAGDLGFVAVYAVELSPTQLATISYLTNQYFGTAL